jgi:conjugative transfer pilus assembly protein TraH
VLGKAKGAQKDQVLRSTNLMWQILSNRALMFADDTVTKQYVMTLTGTVIFDDAGNVTVVPPMASRDDLVHILLKGGQSLMYTCGNTKDCLKITVGKLQLASNQSLQARVNKLIDSIVSKAISDTNLTAMEQSFINSTNVKILRYVIDAQSVGIMESQLVMLSDYIAFDILLKYLRDMLDQVEVGLSIKNFPEEQRALVRNNLKTAYRQLNELQAAVKYREDALMSMDKSIGYTRQQLSTGMLSKYQENYSFEAK